MSKPVELYETSSLRLPSVRRYLSAVGWHRLLPKDGLNRVVPYDLYKSAQQNAGSEKIVLPLSMEAPDWRSRVRDAIQTLSDVEDRSSAEVIQSIQRIGYDVVRSALPNEQVEDDTIKLSSASEFVSSMRGLLAATATTEHRPLPYFGRLLKDGVRFADTCRFGHTYRGSFGFVVESPLPEPESMPLLVDDVQIPFERKVIQRLARGISSIVAAREALNTSLITTAVRTGLSANGCEQLADLIENVNPAGVKFSFDLSPAWGIAREMDSTTFTLDAGHADVCRSAARELRRDDTTRPVKLSGRVVRLQNQSDPTDLSNRTGEHEIMVLWASRDLGDIQVRVNLSPADYLSSVAAHGAGRPIWVSGLLSRLGRQWLLNQPYDFVVPAQGELPLEDDLSA